MERRLTILVMAVSLAALQAKAQDDDFGIWAEANIEKKLTNSLSIDAGMELRTRDDGFGELDRWSLGTGAEYKFTDWLKASLGYSFLSDNNVKDKAKLDYTGGGYPKVKQTHAEYWGNRHRVSLSLTASHAFGNLTVSLRERWQYTYRPEKTVMRSYVKTVYEEDYYGEVRKTETGDEEHVYSGKGSNKWRNRLQLKYKLNRQWRPYLSAESTVGGSGLDKMRYTIGTELRLSKQHSVSLDYMYQHIYSDDDSEGNRHVIGMGYSFKF